MEMQRTLDGKPADTYVGQSIARTGANPRIIEYYAQLIGHLRGAGTIPIFPITDSCGLVEPEESTVYTLDANYYKGPAQQARTMILCDSGPRHKVQLRSENIAPLRANTGAGHNNLVVKRAPLKFLGRNQKSCDDGDYAFTIDSCNTGGIEYQDDTFIKTIDGKRYQKDFVNDDWIETTNSNIRRLTPTECERLQGFPDNWTEGISDTQRYKCLGNAVTVNVIEFISLHIKEMLYHQDA